MKQTIEEKKYLKENKALYKFIKSEGWKICKDKLVEQINDLQSIMNVDGKTADEVFIDIKVRKIVVEELVRWVDSVEGQANQFENNMDSPGEKVDSFIYQDYQEE